MAKTSSCAWLQEAFAQHYQNVKKHIKSDQVFLYPLLYIEFTKLKPNKQFIDFMPYPSTQLSLRTKVCTRVLK